MDVSDLNKDDYDDEYEYEDELNTRRALYEPFVDRFMRGGIRLNKQDVRKLIENIPYISPDMQEETPMAKNASTSQRMSRAYDKLVDKVGSKEQGYKGKAAIDIIKKANEIRKERGAKPIGIKGLDISKDSDAPSRIPDKRRVFDRITDADD